MSIIWPLGTTVILCILYRQRMINTLNSLNRKRLNMCNDVFVKEYSLSKINTTNAPGNTMEYELLKNITDDILTPLKEHALISLGKFTDDAICETLLNFGCDGTIIDKCVQNKDASEFQEYLRQKNIKVVYTKHLQMPDLNGFYFYRDGNLHPCAFISDIHIAHSGKDDGQCIVFEVKAWQQ